MDRKSRPLMFAVGAAVVSAAALIAVQWPYIRAWYRPPQAGLPDPDQVVRAEAVVWASGSRGAIETGVPRFTLAAPAGPRLLQRFMPNTYVPRPEVKADAPLGELVLESVDGQVTRLLFYETGRDELVFTADGEHFFRAEPRNDWGHSLGGALLLAGSIRYEYLTMLREVELARAADVEDTPVSSDGQVPVPAR